MVEARSEHTGQATGQIRRQNEDRIGAELSAGRHERQLNVKVNA